MDRLLTKTPDSYLANAKAKPEEVLWNLNTHVLALLADQLSVSNFLQGQGLVARGAYKQNPVPDPTPIPRPGVQAEKAKRKRGLRAAIRAIDPIRAAKAGV